MSGDGLASADHKRNAQLLSSNCGCERFRPGVGLVAGAYPAEQVVGRLVAVRAVEVVSEGRARIRREIRAFGGIRWRRAADFWSDFAAQHAIRLAYRRRVGGIRELIMVHRRRNTGATPEYRRRKPQDTPVLIRCCFAAASVLHGTTPVNAGRFASLHPSYRRALSHETLSSRGSRHPTLRRIPRTGGEFLHMVSASPNPNFVRTAPGPTNRAADKSVVAEVPKTQTTHSTNQGLLAAGATALFRVYVVLTTANEKGSNTVSITHPG